MDDKINEIFKSALEGHEMPYNANAWKAFESNLDGKQVPKKSNLWKWLTGAAALVAIIGGFLAIEPSQQANSGEKNSPELLSNNKKTEIISTEVKAAQIKEKLVKKETKNKSLLNLLQEEIPTIASVIINLNEEGTLKTNLVNNELETNASDNDYNLVDQQVFYPEIDINCVNEEQWIENKNSFNLMLQTPTGEEIVLLANQKTLITAKSKGTYKIGWYIEPNNFNVYKSKFINDVPALDVLTEELNYDNGLPTLPVKFRTNEDEVVTQYDNRSITSNSSEQNVYLFEKGDIQIRFTTSNTHSCKTTVVKEISVNENYNLLAVNAFDPYSSDNRKNSFMPFALTKRTSPFVLVIIDPADGGVVFQSNDASNSWDGYDKRNGKMVAQNKAFIWKVSLQNPEKKEKSDYKGTIIRL